MSDYISEYQLEIENRIKNMVWTICGDYHAEARPDLLKYQKAPDIALYDAVKQGAFFQFFDKEKLSLYLIKKVYMGADEAQLMNLSQLCIEAAVSKKIEQRCPGTRSLRKRAFGVLLKADKKKMERHTIGKTKIDYMMHALGNYRMDDMERHLRLEELLGFSDIEETDELIAKLDDLFNAWVDPAFIKNHVSLENILAVTLEEMQEFNWRDFLSEEMIEENLEEIMEKMAQEMVNIHTEELSEENEADPSRKKITIVKEEDLARVYTYIERYFGKSYLTPLEEKRRNYQYCKGIHSDCGLYYTKGILASPVCENNQYVIARRQQRKNREVLKSYYNVVKQNIQSLTELLRKTMILHDEMTVIPADSGTLVPARLWKVGRIRDPKLFIKEQKAQHREMVVEILIDASGSQRIRQEKLVLQAFILMEALSNVGIAHRVDGFCTFWDYTIIQQYRDYDDDRSANDRIFSFTTSSNNRDGLAIRAAAGDLINREEDKKILIILSDGRPYDVIANRPNARNPQPYRGEYAIEDTAKEIRKLRNNGVAVLGIFAGEEKDLSVEKRVFGKDFAYIKDIGNFSKVTGRYLSRKIEE